MIRVLLMSAVLAYAAAALPQGLVSAAVTAPATAIKPAAVKPAAKPVLRKRAPQPKLPPNTAALRYPGALTATVQSGGTTYRLTLMVEPAINHVAANLTLLLQPEGALPEAPNLLDPPGNWHGYQAYTFAASDFAEGPAQALFGAVRTVCRNATGLNTTITVKDAAVGRAPTSEREFQSLTLEVQVDPAPVTDGQIICITGKRA